jgi:dephospho-CoA kinase
MLKVAITGGPGSGKSLVRSFFQHHGAHAIDLDRLARDVVKPGSDVFREIVAHFGKQIVDANGTLNRKKLRKMILQDPQSRDALEKMMHPAIKDLLKKKLAQVALRRSPPVVVVEVPLLVEADMQDSFDVVILVDADSTVRKDRIMARDRCSEKEAEALIGLHLPTKEKRRAAHYLVENTGAMESTKAQVERIYAKIMKTP